MRPLTRSKHLTGVTIGTLTTAVLCLAIPVSSYATDKSASPSAADHKVPDQAQWRHLDSASRSLHALGVFGGNASDLVLTLPAGTSAGEQAKAEADIPEGMKVAVKTSKFTKNEVDSIQKVVIGAKWNRGAAKYSVGSTYDGTEDKVIVNTDAPASVTASLKRAYGDKIEVRRSRFEQQYNRFNDAEPFFGGGSIHTDSWGNCTAGWHVRMTNPETSQTADFLTTAGHCYTLHELVKNANGNWAGWVKRFGEFDAEGFVGYRYGSSIWTGGISGSTAASKAVGLSGMYNGLKVCVSGQTSFNHCGHPITATQYAFTWTDHNGHTHHTNASDGFTYARGGTNAPDYNNGTVTQGGDSGAPVYVPYTNGSALATGSHSGLLTWLDTTSGGCHCTQYRMYGVKMQALYDSWGARLVTQ
ncbi:hypothetical protein ACIQVK_22095 [Streptomyces sp. NPDC090493]|uniref:hypothetical protein n=1 Tax=Streptomyces sp. NPDC090493 TaxID=3365964 RepID=UPI00380FD811